MVECTIFWMSTAWNQIVGHEWAVDLLRGAIIHDRVGHAYLFTGPRQVGKTTLARSFAMALNCEASSLAERPCGHCRPCKLIGDGRHPDVRLLLPEVSGRGKSALKIDQIRGLQQELSLTPTEARYKIAIIKQFDAANQSAANAFLKTLEEPPNHVILLLTASEADALLPTITSRCRTIALRPLPTNSIEQVLGESYRAKPDQAHLLSHLVGPSPLITPGPPLRDLSGAGAHSQFFRLRREQALDQSWLLFFAPGYNQRNAR